VSRAAVFCGLLRCGREATACEFCVAVGSRDEVRYSITDDRDRRLTRHPLRSPVAHWTPDSHRRETPRVWRRTTARARPRFGRTQNAGRSSRTPRS